jgi:hypothetical protein
MMLLATLPSSYQTVATTLIGIRGAAGLTISEIAAKAKEQQDLHAVTSNKSSDSGPSQAARTSTTKHFKKYCAKCKKECNHSTEQHCDNYAEQKKKEREERQQQQGGDNNNLQNKNKKDKKDKNCNQSNNGQQNNCNVTVPGTNSILVSLYTPCDLCNNITIWDKYNNAWIGAVIEEVEDQVEEQTVLGQACKAEAHIWLIDTGASTHLTPFKQDFLEYTANPHTHYASLADGSKVPILGQGTVMIHTALADGTLSNLCASNVLYMPQCTQRIISPQRITAHKKYYWIIDKTRMTLHSKGDQRLLAIAPLSHHDFSYWMYADSCKSEEPETVKSLSNWDLWHGRYRHAGRDIMAKLPKSVIGTPDNLGSHDDTKPCAGCMFGKQHQNPFPASPKQKPNVLDLIHSDLEEMPHLSIDGYKWTVTFLNNCSSKGVMYALKRKSNTLEALKMYQAWVKHKFG